MSSSNFITIWGYIYPRQIFLQEREAGASQQARYVFELSHSDVQYATRVETTRVILTIAQTEYNRVVPTPITLPSTTTNDVLFAIVSGFSTAVRLNMDIIGEISDYRQSVIASAIYLVPCGQIHIERHVQNRSIARDDAFTSGREPNQDNRTNSRFVNTALRLDTSEEDPSLRLIHNDGENENNQDDDLFRDENDGESNGGDSGEESDDTITSNNYQSQRSVPALLGRASQRSNTGRTATQSRQTRNSVDSTSRSTRRVTRSASQSSFSSVSTAEGQSDNLSRFNTTVEDDDEDNEEFDNNPPPAPQRKRRRGLTSRV